MNKVYYSKECFKKKKKKKLNIIVKPIDFSFHLESKIKENMNMYVFNKLLINIVCNLKMYLFHIKIFIVIKYYVNYMIISLVKK